MAPVRPDRADREGVAFNYTARNTRLLLPMGEKDGMRGLGRCNLGTWEFQLNLPNPSPQPSPYGRGSSPSQPP
jgi:hypothetical protein